LYAYDREKQAALDAWMAVLDKALADKDEP
jgi:hypothetical protein